MNVQDLLGKNDLEYLFFWKPIGEFGYLSQWYKSEFKENDEVFYTAEHYMMAGKAKLFNDEITRNKILSTKDPYSVKKLGRLVKNFNNNEWQDKQYSIVYKGNIEKFSQNKLLKDKLLSTGDKILVEASPYDNIWGVGLEDNNTLINNPVNWRGTNLLGFILMDVRNFFKINIL